MKNPTPLPGQMELVSGILKLMGDRLIDSGHMNAVIRAADGILKEFNRARVYATPSMGYRAWLQSDDTGLSSEYLARCLMGEKPDFRTNVYPADPSDFGRCVRMLEALNISEEQFAEVAINMPKPWPQLYMNWPHLCAIYRAELPSGSSPKLYDEMKALYKRVLT